MVRHTSSGLNNILNRKDYSDSRVQSNQFFVACEDMLVFGLKYS